MPTLQVTGATPGAGAGGSQERMQWGGSDGGGGVCPGDLNIFCLYHRLLF